MALRLAELVETAETRNAGWDETIRIPTRRRGPIPRLTLREARQRIETWRLPAYLTKAEAAGLIRRAPGTLANMVSQGLFPASAICGKRLMFDTLRFLIEAGEMLEGRR